MDGQNLLTRLTPVMHTHFRKTGAWKDDTIHSLAAGWARADPSRAAVQDTNVTLRYGDLVNLAERLAARLAAEGLRPGDRVAAWLSNRVEFAILLVACSRNGYVFCPSLHRNQTVHEIVALTQRMDARALFAENGYGADANRNNLATAIAGQVQLAMFRMLPEPAQRGVHDMADALGCAGMPDKRPSGEADAIVYLAFTSGTTGEPKGVMHSNNTLLANARALAADWNFQPTSVTYTLSPLSHNLGFGALVLALLTGGSIVLHDLRRCVSLLDRLGSVGATFVFGVPAHAMDLLEEIETRGSAGMERLTGFRISGAAAPPGLVEGLLRHGVVAQSGYGMTEAGSHHYTLPGDDPARITGTSGKACNGYEVAIFARDDPDRRLPVGEVGQIGGRGASLMLGYFDSQISTERAFNRDAWFMTGDLGQLDGDGYLRITGRIKDIIIRGGHNIHPARIEELAMRHGGIERAAALPVKDARLGEKVCLIVMPKPGHGVGADEILAHLDAEGLSRYDMPEYFLQAEIPLGPSGKVQKRALLPALEAGELVPQPIRWSSGDT